VTGTLRDQIVYPSPPRAVLASASPAERARFAAISGGRDELPEDIDEQLARILAKVELEYLPSRGSGWDQVRRAAGRCCSLGCAPRGAAGAAALARQPPLLLGSSLAPLAPLAHRPFLARPPRRCRTGPRR
jgi:hypothetical protein